MRVDAVCHIYLLWESLDDRWLTASVRSVPVCPMCSVPLTGTEGPMPMADTAKDGAKAPKRNGGKKAAKKAVEVVPPGVCVCLSE